jgi:hypothetical protein
MTERINTFLRSEAALLTLLAMALISQTPHTAVLFHRLSPQVEGVANIAAWLHAVAYAVALEFATLVFVVRGQRSLAWLFAIVSVGVNLLYYAVGEWTPLYVVSALLVSFALPSSIAFYSHGIAQIAHGGSEDAAQVPAHDDVQSAQVAQVEEPPTQIAPKMSAAQRRMHIAESGIDDARLIAAQFGISLRSAQADLAAVRRATLATNGKNHA